MAVFYADVGYVVVIVQADNEYAELALFAGHVLQVYVADDGWEAAVALLAVFVLQVDAEHGFAALAYGDIAHKYVLYDSAAAGAGLDADDAIQVGAVHLAVLHVQVVVAAGDFAADNYAAVTVLHEAVAHDDVLTGGVPFAPVGITTRLDGDAVVTGIEDTVFYQYVLAGFGVAAVAVGTTVEDVYTAHSEAFAEQRVNDPEG